MFRFSCNRVIAVSVLTEGAIVEARGTGRRNLRSALGLLPSGSL